MSFALNGTHIEGGTFNNVSGNMTQVFNSHVRPIGEADRGPHFGRTNHGSRNRHNEEERFRACADNTNSGDSRNSISPIIEYEGRGNGAVCFTSSMHPDTRDGRYNPADIPTTFNSVGGNMTQLSITAYGDSGIDILYRSVVMEALHDSGERFPEPACHPGTRTMVLEELKIWSVDTNPESAIMWLYGAAGMGKSAVAQMFAGDCQAEGRLGASFFFRRGHPKRGTWNGLFTTLAYQLATSVSELLLPVQRAVEDDKLVVGRAMAVQFQKLFLSPFQSTPNLHSIPVIVLDGLDECKDHHVQQQILRLFITGIRNHCLPVRLLITSRPEPHICETLQSEDSLVICHYSELTADDSAYTDIRMYLWDEFSRIYREFLARGIDLGPNWPAPQAVTHLVKKSSGIFIYAATVIRFIGDEYTHPAERLTAVLSLDPRSTAPLDDLYTEILSVVPPEATRLRILHAIWQGTQDNFLFMRPEHVETLLLLSPGTSRLALRALHSLVYVPPPHTRFSVPDDVYPLHASFGDYLGDPRRSGQWCVSVPWLHSDFLHCALRLLASPRSTVDTRNFHTNIVGGLPRLLSHVPPSDIVISLLRNEQVQNSIFLRFKDCRSWPQRDSGYPRDLIQLWGDYQFIAGLVDCSISTTDQTSPTYKFDAIYREILCQNTDLLFLLRSRIIKPHNLEEAVFYLGPQYNPRIFRSLLQIRELFRSPPTKGDSPIDFLTDPRRAGNLYSNPRNIAEDLVVLWIQHAKKRLMEGDLDFASYWLDLLDICRPSSRILHELENLDLAQLCDPKNIHPADHHKVHARVFSNPRPARAVLDWLQRFPDPPLQAIAFWEKQRAIIDQCVFEACPT